MAEREGFEPTDRSPGQLFSRQPHSTALPSLHTCGSIVLRPLVECCLLGNAMMIWFRNWFSRPFLYPLYNCIISNFKGNFTSWHYTTNMEQTYSLQTWAKNAILREKAQHIDKITKDVRMFSAILLDKMYEFEWVGLAAPQIWVSKRIIAVTFWKEKDKKQVCIGDEVMINPVITRKSDEKYLFEEACLSLPGKRWDVLRHKHIKVHYKSPDGREHVKKLSNMSAVIVQHEIDHLDGILFIDKVL